MGSAPAPSAGEGQATQPAPGSEAAPQGQPAAAGGSAPGDAGNIENVEATGQDGLELEYTESKVKSKKPPPGVMDEGPILATERPRDDKGRFVKAGEPPERPTEGEPTAPQSEETPAVPEPPVDPNAPKKFVFAGKEFESQEAAEQNFKSLQGQFKPLIEDRNRAAESANGWHQVAQSQQTRIQELEAELEAARKGAPAQSQPATAGTQDAPDAVDWELYAEIRKAAEAQGEPWRADKWLHEQVEAVQQKRETALREELNKPFKDAQARQEQLAGVEKLASELAEYVNDSDGQPSFPELRDPKAAYMIGRLWKQMGLPTEYAQSPQGMVAAIALYRMVNGPTTAEAAAAPTGSQDPTPAAPPAPNPAAAAAEMGPGQPEPMPTGDTSPRAALLAGLRRTQLTRKGLGFSE